MLPYLRDHHADPGRLHAEGLRTRVAVEQAREQVAVLVDARPREVVFTASGSEAVNHAVTGAVARSDRHHVVTTAVEHSAVTESVRRAANDVTTVGVDRLGRWDPAAVIEAVQPNTALVSVQTANHEVGTLQRVEGLAAALGDRGVLLHVDACASFGNAPLSFAALGADLCSITAHKVGGPKGAAALLVRRGLRVPSLVLGGAQERARRAGLENVPAIVGFGALCSYFAGKDVMESETTEARRLIDRAASVALAVDGVARFGDAADGVGNLICLGVEGVEAEPILLGLDQQGVAVHSGSACSSETLEPSPVLAAMGVDAQHSLRVSVGWNSETSDIDRFIEAFSGIVDRLRALRGDAVPDAGGA